MNCRKCKIEIPDESTFCLHCGAKQTIMRGKKKRGNGQGTVYKRGDTYTARLEKHHKGKRIIKTEGGFPTKTAANDYIPELKRQIAEQIANPRKSKLTKGITLKALYERWEPYYTPRVGKSTMGGHRSAFKWFQPLWYEDFMDICTDDLQDCVNECARGKRTKENMKSLMVALYDYAAMNRMETANYGRYIYCGNDAEGTWPPFDAAELEIVRKAVISGIKWADYVYVFCYTGFRPNELFRLEDDAYDPENETLCGGFKTEAGTNRIVTLSPKIKHIVREYAEAADPYIFPRADGTLMTDDYFRDSIFNPLMEQLGIKGKVPYSCRHTFSNLMKVVKGADVDKAALMGHTDYSMTKKYQSADYESLKNITDKL